MAYLQIGVLFQELGLGRRRDLPTVTYFCGSAYCPGLKWRTRIIIWTMEAVKEKQSL